MGPKEIPPSRRDSLSKLDDAKIERYVSERKGNRKIDDVKTDRTLSQECPAIFAPEKKKARINPRDFLESPMKAFVLAEILRPLE